MLIRQISLVKLVMKQLMLVFKFLGQSSWYYATNAYNSNFLGWRLVMAQQLLIIQISLVQYAGYQFLNAYNFLWS
jgi:hypothetical protein